MKHVGRIVSPTLRIVAVVLAAYVAFCSPAASDSYRLIIPAVYNPSVSMDGTTLYGGDWSSYNQVTVTCYHPANANSVCAGGGNFDRGDCPSGAGDPSNFATLIRDNQGAGVCWYRKNFGLNGVVDARQCGVYGDGIHDDAGTLNTCLKIAAELNLSTDPPLQNLVPVVNTGGGVILDNSNTITVPDNVVLTCGENSMVQADNNDYRIFKSDLHTANLTHAIVIDPTAHGGSYYTLALEGNNSGLVGCLVEAGAGTLNEITGHYPNPYSPSRWYPTCSFALGSCSDTGNLDMRSAIAEYSAFNPKETAEYNVAAGTCASSGSPVHCGPASQSVGITVRGPHAILRNVTVLGFGTCMGSDPVHGFGAFAALDHTGVDCDIGYSIVNSNGPHLYDTRARSLLTAGDIRGLNIDTISGDGLGHYQVRVVNDAHSPSLTPSVGDTVWITPASGAESAAGSWSIQSVTSGVTCSGGGTGCSNLVLQGSVSNGFTLSGDVSSTPVNGLPATAIRNITTTATNLPLVAVGQQVSDTPGGACIQPGTTVTAVWPARGIVYISQPPICTAPGDSIAFNDHAYSGTAMNCDSLGPEPPPTTGPTGCAIFDAAFRFGDGFYLNDAGGLEAVGCTAYEHQVGFHLREGVNNNRWTNCATGDNIGLPDRNLAGLNYSGSGPFKGNLVSLWIEGAHFTGDGVLPDACDISWSNAVLGQHRPYAIVIQSNCDIPDKFTNMNLGVNENGGQNASVEVDAGSLSLANATSNGKDKVFKADGQTFATGPTSFPAQLSISNNNFPDAQLYVENTHAASSIVGCGNTFAAPTPYLCAPSSFSQLPGGRLSLASGTSSNCNSPLPPAVMTADATQAGCIFYVPYVSQSVPIYSATAGSFGLLDIGATGLKLGLDSSNHVAGKVYDVFVEPYGSNGSAELCSLAWGGSVTARTTDVTQVGGVWVNKAEMQCSYNNTSSTRDCPALSCTYVGSFYATANGETEQQFGPNTVASGGLGNCLCLYNAYNRVTVTSTTYDPTGYTYSSSTWRYLDANSGNSISLLDGLGQMRIGGLLNDALQNATGGSSNRIAAIGVEVLAPLGTPGSPPLIIEANSPTKGSYSATLAGPPQQGLRTAYGVESALSGTSGMPGFGGSGLQQLSVTVSD